MRPVIHSERTLPAMLTVRTLNAYQEKDSRLDRFVLLCGGDRTFSLAECMSGCGFSQPLLRKTLSSAGGAVRLSGDWRGPRMKSSYLMIIPAEAGEGGGIHTKTDKCVEKRKSIKA